MHKFVFGSLNWTPYEYYTSTPYELYCACEGFFDKEDRQEMMVRKLAYVNVQIAGGNYRKPDDLWQVFLDGIQEPDKILPMTEEEFAAIMKDKYENIKKKHGIN